METDPPIPDAETHFVPSHCPHPKCVFHGRTRPNEPVRPYVHKYAY